MESGRSSGSATLPPPVDVTQTPRTLAEHVLAMADDDYLRGHPEWEAIVAEARAVLAGGGAVEARS